MNSSEKNLQEAVCSFTGYTLEGMKDIESKL
jgi:hypothetical protein